jgi:hypothetical protein
MKYKGCHFEKNEIKKVRACDLKRYITLAKNAIIDATIQAMINARRILPLGSVHSERNSLLRSAIRQAQQVTGMAERAKLPQNCGAIGIVQCQK